VSPADRTAAGRYGYLHLRRRDDEAVDLADAVLETTLYRPDGTRVRSFGFGRKP